MTSHKWWGWWVWWDCRQPRLPNLAFLRFASRCQIAREGPETIQPNPPSPPLVRIRTESTALMANQATTQGFPPAAACLEPPAPGCGHHARATPSPPLPTWPRFGRCRPPPTRTPGVLVLGARGGNVARRSALAAATAPEERVPPARGARGRRRARAAHARFLRKQAKNRPKSRWNLARDPHHESQRLERGGAAVCFR